MNLTQSHNKKEMIEYTNIPDDIFTCIFEFLEAKDLLNVSLMNNQWYNTTMGPVVWSTRTLILKQYGVDNIPDSMIQFFKQCNITKFQVYCAGHINQLIQQFSTVVTELDFVFNDRYRENPVKIIPAFPALQKFHSQLQLSNLSDWIRQMPNLTSLNCFHVYNVKLDQIKLSKLKYLELDHARCSDILSILSSCNDTLEHLILSNLDPDNYLPVKLTLPKIETLHFNANEETAFPEFYSVLIANIDGSSVKSLSILCEVTGSRRKVFERVVSGMTNLEFARIPPTIFSFIPTIRHVYSLVLLESIDTDLNEHAMNILETGDRLQYISLNADTSTAENWLFRLVNTCQKLQQLYMYIKTTSYVNFSGMKMHECLSQVHIDYSSVREYLNAFLMNLPNLKYIDLKDVPLDEYSSVLEIIDEYRVGFGVLIHPTDGYSTPFNQCHYILNNDQVGACGIVESQLNGIQITLEQFLLAMLCTANERLEYYSLHLEITENIDAVLGVNQEDDITDDFIAQLLNRLLNKVVPMITGISENKRNELLQLTTENNKVMQLIQQQIMGMYPEIWE
jgi:hypothetical protein